MIDRVTHAHAVNAINELMYFVVVTLLFLLLAKHSSAALPCKQFVNKCLKHVNDFFATPQHTQMLALQL